MHVEISSHKGLTGHLVQMDTKATQAALDAGLERRVVDLVRLRVSQVNGCAYCLRQHTREAIEDGETPERLAVLPAWWESQYFTPQERAALALAEDVTRLPVPDTQRWDDGSLTPEQASAVAWVAMVMNSWNRYALLEHLPVGPRD